MKNTMLVGVTSPLALCSLVYFAFVHSRE